MSSCDDAISERATTPTIQETTTSESDIEKDSQTPANTVSAEGFPHNLMVSLIGSSVIDTPPMIPAKDLETQAVIANHGSEVFEFTFLRAVYFGDDTPLSTTVYFNMHSPEMKAQLEQEMGEKADDTQPAEKITYGIPAEDDLLPAPPEEQFTIAGYPFEGDFYDKNFFHGISTTGNFAVPAKEELNVFTQSAGTYLGNPLRYKDRKVLLDFLDADGSSMGKVTLIINE